MRNSVKFVLPIILIIVVKLFTLSETSPFRPHHNILHFYMNLRHAAIFLLSEIFWSNFTRQAMFFFFLLKPYLFCTLFSQIISLLFIIFVCHMLLNKTSAATGCLHSFFTRLLRLNKNPKHFS